MKKSFVKFVHVFLMFTMVLLSVAPGIGVWINTAQAEEITPTETPVVVTPVVAETPAVLPVVEPIVTPTDEIVIPVTEEVTAPVVETAPIEEIITPTPPRHRISCSSSDPCRNLGCNSWQ